MGSQKIMCLFQMLQEMGFIMDDVQFQEFTSMLNCDKRGLSYSDFVACFQDLRINGMGEVRESLIWEQHWFIYCPGGFKPPLNF